VIDYLRDPATIYKRSFEIIRAETDFSKLPKNAEAIATRVVHACGMPEIVDDLVITETFPPAAIAALANGKSIFVDAEMVSGVT